MSGRIARTAGAMLAAALVVVGCDSGGGGGGGGGTKSPPPATGGDPGEWPGGSAGGWEEGDGLEQRWHREPGGGADSGGGGADLAEGGASAGPPAPPAADRDDGAPAADPQPGGGLEGGEIDDNADFEEFLAYAERALERFGEDPMVHWLDVRRRHLITVRDAAGRTVPDATVSVFAGDELITWGRTRADGRYALFPRAFGDDADTYTVQVSTGDLSGSAELTRADETLTVALDGDRPAEDAFRVDVAFVIDTTGSMGEEIDRIKATVSDIAARVAGSEHAPDLRLALVDYRDFGDAYVTHAVNFTRDVQAFQGAIDQLAANGGGDMPEALNEALHEALRRLEWRREPTLRLAFIVADAPAHHYEQAPYTYDDAMLDAATMGVKIFPIASGGSDGVAELQFRQLAQFTLGHFIFITEGGGSPHGSGGSDYDVDPQDFDVERLDDLVVRLITAEMDAWNADDASIPPR